MAALFDFKINDRDVQAFLSGLRSKEAAKLFLSAVRKGMNILARQTTANFKANRRKGWKQRRVKRITKSGKEKGKILHVAKTVTNKKEDTVKVHIMEDFRVKWLEMGTKERWTHTHSSTVIDGRGNKQKKEYKTINSRYVGKILPEWFFKKAHQQTKDQVVQKINLELKKSILIAAKSKRL